MQLGDALYDRQPKARAARLAAVAPPEAPEDQLALMRGNAGALIQNADLAIMLHDELDGRAWCGVVDGVFREVADRPAQHFRVSLDPHGFGRAG